MMEPPFETTVDYRVPLLRVLALLPGGRGQKQLVLQTFLDRYGQRIPPEHHQVVSEDRTVWRRYLHRGHRALLRMGLAENPQWGVWQISPAGLEWLRDNPTASRVDHPKMARSPSPRLQGTATAEFSDMSQEEFLGRLHSVLTGLLSSTNGHPSVVSEPGTNFVNVAYREFAGTHYTVRLARGVNEIGLHFESSRAANMARLEVFRRHLESVVAATGLRLKAEPRGSNWARVWTPLPREPLSEALAGTYAQQLARFIEVSLPVLREAYAESRRRESARPARPESTDTDPQTIILRRELSAIRAFLAGRASHPSDEKLCDWVSLCYTVELFSEGQALFRLVEPGQVNPWYYDRTKKLASVCAMKAKGRA
jgi:hypothetical protein